MKKMFMMAMVGILSLASFALDLSGVPEAQTGMFRKIKGSTMVITNGTEIIEALTNVLANAKEPNTVSTTWSHPQDWRIWWESIDTTKSDVVTTNSIVDKAGRTISTVTYSVIKNDRAKLYFDYLDQINLPEFEIDSFSVVDGPGVIQDGDILVASESGSITVRGTTSKGTYQDTVVNLYNSKSSSSYSFYSADSNLNRKRVNDFHLSMLQQYRSNPNTNRVYTIWSADGGVKLVGNTGDVYTGQYGDIWKPYHHKTSNSGGNCSWWWSHAPITKHTLLAADHYGWNNTRTKVEYIGWQSSSNPGVKLTITNYYSLATWAKEHEIPEEYWAGCGDIGIHIVKEDIPDEYLPYIATADYLNETYGTDSPNDAYIPCISLNQANMVALRAAGVGVITDTSKSYGWGWHSGGPVNGRTEFDDGIIKNVIFREDIYQYARLGGWHSVIMGDSGNPVFFYDPDLVISGTNEMRPVLMFAYHFGGGSGGSGPSIPRYTKVLKMFLESIGETLPFTLGDLDNQEANSVTKE